MVALFLIDPTVIWLDFEAPGLPESREIEKKMLLEFCCFLIIKKYARDRFYGFRVSFWGQFWSPGLLKRCRIRFSFLVLFLEGPILNSGSLFLSKTMCFTRVFFRI